ncbi:Uncharacterized protein Fot_04215 [Forsythia ovata]|uniref:Uncharacterized protein n=1 Tax=Forsythia ovata TaxID=205694 RepID=A0ABD1XCI6_9LAMI
MRPLIALAKVAYQKRKDNLFEVESNIAVLTNMLDLLLMPSRLLLRPGKSEWKKSVAGREAPSCKEYVTKLSEEVAAKEAEIAKLKSNLEASAKGKLDAEEAYTNLLAEKRYVNPRNKFKSAVPHPFLIVSSSISLHCLSNHYPGSSSGLASLLAAATSSSRRVSLLVISKKDTLWASISRSSKPPS